MDPFLTFPTVVWGRNKTKKKPCARTGLVYSFYFIFWIPFESTQGLSSVERPDEYSGMTDLFVWVNQSFTIVLTKIVSLSDLLGLKSYPAQSMVLPMS